MICKRSLFCKYNIFDTANRLASVTHLSATQPYTFDRNGNLLTSGVMTNSFDAANRLASSSRSTVTVQPVYNGVGDRVRQTVGATTTYYTLDVEGLPEVITSDGEIYLHLPGVIVTEKAGQVRYLLGDGLGSIRQAIDGTGTVVAYNEYDPYGNPVQEGSQPYGFTGEWWQEELELLHLRARWLMPETGTFLSRDPVESEPPYQYVRGNPVNRIDPSGMIYCNPVTGYCQEIDRFLCSHTPGAYDSRGLNRPCIVSPNNVQTGNRPPPSSTDTSCFPSSPTDTSWMNCQDDRDLTNWLYRELIDGATRNRDVAELRWMWKTSFFPNPLALEGWATLVRDNHRFDFKHAIEDQFSSRIILFHTSTGLPYTAEYSIPGNIFFGYVGSSIGFWGWLTHAGAGWAEGRDPAHVGDPNRWTISVCDWETGFYANPDWVDTLYDDPDDYQAVELGIRLWNKYKEGLTEPQLIRELEQNLPQLAPTPVEYGGNSYGWRNPEGWWPYKIGQFKGAKPSYLFGSNYGSPSFDP